MSGLCSIAPPEAARVGALVTPEGARRGWLA